MTLSGRLAANAAWFFKAAAAVHLFRENGCELTVPVGVSMVPTFAPAGEAALVARGPLAREISRGDVVVARSPKNPRHIVIKRVVGVSGDEVVIRRSSRVGGPARVETVPRGHVWLQGDNFDASLDSRTYGPVPRALVLGRVFLRVFPPWKAGWIVSEPPEGAEDVVQAVPREALEAAERTLARGWGADAEAAVRSAQRGARGREDDGGLLAFEDALENELRVRSGAGTDAGAGDAGRAARRP